MFSSFIFRVTNLCDKRCPTCCCETGIDTIEPEKFRKKLLEISDYFQNKPDNKCVIFLTGGEPFFYRKKSISGKIWNIVDLVQLVKKIIPTSNIIIKTSGWENSDTLDNLVCMIATQRGIHAEVRLGFNLFQKRGINAEKRLNHMLALLLTFQQSVVVETIYNKGNKDRTMRIIGKTLAIFSREFEKFAEELSSPNESYIVDFPFTLSFKDSLANKIRLERKISLWTMPAHSGKSKKCQEEYYKCSNSGICSNIKFGPTQIMYNTDLTFNHCNDAFADFSYPAFIAKNHWKVNDEFIFLRKKFNNLRYLLDGEKAFHSKNEQCALCSKLIHEV